MSYNCEYCGKKFVQKHKRHKFCSNLCKGRKNSEDFPRVQISCTNCGKSIERKFGKAKDRNYCSKECEFQYKHKMKYEDRSCPICGKIFETTKIRNQIFCSLECLNEKQKVDPYCVGEKNHNYKKDEPHFAICEICGKEFKASPYKIKSEGFARFCSKKCAMYWHSNVWSQTDEWKDNRRKWAVDMLESGLISKTSTAPQLLINEMLNNANIPYINEKSFSICAVDNYLVNHNLVIEVMGEYWHCDNRKYAEIKYENQKRRIKMDKIKKSYLRNNYKINVLYLWERDIYDNENLCKKLIDEYVGNNGVLKDYHSFNYSLNGENLKLNENLIVPYMDWNIEDIKNIVIPELKEKISKKQKDKWTIYYCENCGREKEQLTSHYNKSQRHFCSTKCLHEFRSSGNDWHRSPQPNQLEN